MPRATAHHHPTLLSRMISPTASPRKAVIAAPPDRTERPAPPVAPEGLPIIAIFVASSAALTALAWWLGAAPAAIVEGVACGVLTLWCIWFFRDPQRVVPTDANAVVCPADGRVVIIDSAAPPAEVKLGGAPLTRICIFMNVFNVHVNRSPVDGTVEKIAYTPGKFFNASFDKASTDNERCSLVVALADGRKVVCVQIAGLIARRIVCRVGQGTVLAAGERFGLIRFGSRVDVYLPAGTVPSVKVGDMTQAGATVIARLGSADPLLT